MNQPAHRRRVLTVELFLTEVQPESRVIKHPLDDQRIVELRPQILGGLWSLVRNWVSLRSPKAKLINQTFVKWSEIVGGILEAAGYASPVEPSGGTQFSGDREQVEMIRLIDEMVEGTAYSFQQLVDLARHHRLLEWIVGDYAGTSLDPKERRRFAGLLQRFEGRIFPNGCRFEVLGTTARKQYGITKVGP
jgi:hypothetical protein